MLTQEEICDAVKEGAIQAASELGMKIALTPNDLDLAEGVDTWEQDEWESLLKSLSDLLEIELDQIKDFLPFGGPTTRIMYVRGDLYLYAQLNSDGVPVLLIGPPEVQPREFAEADHVRCINSIDLFFKSPRGEDTEELQRAINHMVGSVRPGTHFIECPPCWAYYTDQKRLYCGG
jgi:hypothetical protein